MKYRKKCRPCYTDRSRRPDKQFVEVTRDQCIGVISNEAEERTYACPWAAWSTIQSGAPQRKAKAYFCSSHADAYDEKCDIGFLPIISRTSGNPTMESARPLVIRREQATGGWDSDVSAIPPYSDKGDQKWDAFRGTITHHQLITGKRLPKQMITGPTDTNQNDAALPHHCEHRKNNNANASSSKALRAQYSSQQTRCHFCLQELTQNQREAFSSAENEALICEDCNAMYDEEPNIAAPAFEKRRENWERNQSTH